jgi:CRISPR-associated protein Csm2
MVSTEAKSVVDKLKRDNKGNIFLTTNQIRKFLAGINGIYNRILAYQGAGKINGDQLPQEIVDEIEYIKVKLVYQSGRERNVKEFMQLADLEKRLDSIGNSKKKFIEFNRFIEGIVAYHKFQGGN